LNPKYTSIPPAQLLARQHSEAEKCARYFLKKALKVDPSLKTLSKNLAARRIQELDQIIEQCADLLEIKQFKK